MKDEGGGRSTRYFGEALNMAKGDNDDCQYWVDQTEKDNIITTKKLAPLPEMPIIIQHLKFKIFTSPHPPSRHLSEFHPKQLADAKYFINGKKGQVIVVNDFKIATLFRRKFLNGGEFVERHNKCTIIVKMNKHDAAIDKINIANRRKNCRSHFRIAFEFKSLSYSLSTFIS